VEAIRAEQYTHGLVVVMIVLLVALRPATYNVPPLIG